MQIDRVDKTLTDIDPRPPRAASSRPEQNTQAAS
eukprot:CAMPEP_0179005264 /NCGR_PEP_ID=MMETSP0795-20121207/13811_1 /TAXON_ID=88552 /ORGANISM="Amoebophrya sp., Strain Ameob2" /LENGTH=33 /DNA_ID= /DNA_START= /DNA_END= /DNA_ORIENTATION=